MGTRGAAVLGKAARTLPLGRVAGELVGKVEPAHKGLCSIEGFARRERGVGGVAREAHELGSNDHGPKLLGSDASRGVLVGVRDAAVPVVHEQVVKLRASAGDVRGERLAAALRVLAHSVDAGAELLAEAREHLGRDRARPRDATAEEVAQGADVVHRDLVTGAVGEDQKLVAVLRALKASRRHGRKRLLGKRGAVGALGHAPVLGVAARLVEDRLADGAALEAAEGSVHVVLEGRAVLLAHPAADDVDAKVDHVGALVANGAGEVGERRGRELVVGVDEDDIVARGLSDAGAPGAVQAAVLRKREETEARVPLGVSARDLGRGVWARVVHDHALPGPMRLEQHGVEAAGQVLGVVIGSDNDRERQGHGLPFA